MGLFNFFASSAPDSSSPGLAGAAAAPADVAAAPGVVAAAPAGVAAAPGVVAAAPPSAVVAIGGAVAFDASCADADSAMPNDRSKPARKIRRYLMEALRLQSNCHAVFLG